MTIAFIMTLILLAIPTERVTFTNNKHVTVEIKAPEKISLTKENELAFFLNPVKGIHINTTPTFELILEKNSQFEIVGKPRFAKDEKSYLDIDKPVEFSIKAKSGTKSGKQSLKGKLNYFYCSDAEGWCNRFSQPFEVSVDVTK